MINKKSLILLIIIIVLVGAAFGIYFYLSGGEENTNVTTLANIEVEVPIVNYEPYSGDDQNITFDTVTEWTSIAPEEIMKSVSGEIKKDYSVVYYSASQDSVILAVSKRIFEGNAKTLEEMFDEDVQFAQSQHESFELTKKEVKDESIIAESYFTSENISWLTKSKAIVIDADAENDSYYILEVSMIEESVPEYTTIADHLVESFEQAN